MGERKKLDKIIDAVKGIVGDDVQNKKFKKTLAVERFIEKMEEKEIEISAELENGGLDEETATILRRHLKTLEKQLKKTRKLLVKMEN